MGLEQLALDSTHDLPIRHEGKVHNGKVRSVYWLSEQDSSKLIRDRGYQVHPFMRLGIMVISDRISAFDCLWKGEGGLGGVPGKGAALNAISAYWFSLFREAKLAPHHIVDIPHPLVWIVERANPIRIEAVCRQYLTGSMFREYHRGERFFCGLPLPNHLAQYQELPNIFLTPTTKGTLHLPGIARKEDTPLARDQLVEHAPAFGFLDGSDNDHSDIARYERLSTEGFGLMAKELLGKGLLLADTKFEFGYSLNRSGHPIMIYIDEVGTPDSSRMWSKCDYDSGCVVELSKENFRQFLMGNLDSDILLNPDRMLERKELAKTYCVPVEEMMRTSDLYTCLAQRIIGANVPKGAEPRSEILDALSQYKLVA